MGAYFDLDLGPGVGVYLGMSWRWGALHMGGLHRAKLVVHGKLTSLSVPLRELEFSIYYLPYAICDTVILPVQKVNCRVGCGQLGTPPTPRGWEGHD